MVDGVLVGIGVLGGDEVAVALSLAVPVCEPVPLALDVPVPDCDGVPVAVPVDVIDGVGLRVAVAEAEGVADADDEPDAVALCEGVGRMMATTRWSTSSDELPVDMPPPLTTDSCSTSDAAGGSTTDRVTHPERPNVPTCDTLTLYRSVVISAPAASVATATTRAESLRKSRDAK